MRRQPPASARREIVSAPDLARCAARALDDPPLACRVPSDSSPRRCFVLRAPLCALRSALCPFPSLPCPPSPLPCQRAPTPVLRSIPPVAGASAVSRRLPHGGKSSRLLLSHAALRVLEDPAS